MIESIKLLKEKSWQNLEFVQPHKYKVEIGNPILESLSATIKITFTAPIILFRNSDYRWEGIKKRMLSNWYAPKILMLSTNQLVQANQHQGIWEVDPKNHRNLLWHFNITNSNPIAQYDFNNSRRVMQAVSENCIIKSLALLLPKQNALEVSRSKIPYSAIACFTDHCDFDTLTSLKLQRAFFKKNKVKVTKGFFLNHYSKRADTASCEQHHLELDAWVQDGHELAYHSLSQSIKPIDESLFDFKNFTSPFKNIDTWIDHGFQPYNVSLYNNYESIKNDYGSILNKKGIHIIWNYIDSGTAAKGIINQINPVQFNLQSFYKGIKHLSVKKKIPMLIKNIIFHFYTTDAGLRSYREIAKFYKTHKQKKTFKNYIVLFKSLIRLFGLLIPIVLFWKTNRKKTYPLAEYSPILFHHDITGETFTVFQTMEMIDFKTGLHPDNIDLLILERGLFVAHTYFSAPMNYHEGKLFEKDTMVNKQVEDNFEYLSQKIESQEIWNPTLGQLVTYLEKFSALTFDCNEKGVPFIENNDHHLAYRDVR